MSKFLRVKCKCGNEQNIFGNSSNSINCLVCGENIAKPTGSRIDDFRGLQGAQGALSLIPYG